MKVELVNYTQDALELLLFTKDVRLKGAAQSLEDIKQWSQEQKLEHLSYMRDTIKSSWEFVDYVFKISDVTRAFTHQFVRTRTNSYAQESQRSVDVSLSRWLTPHSLDEDKAKFFDRIIQDSIYGYAALLGAGVSPGDARGVIPTNIHTSIISKINLRSMSAMAEVRMCTRTQGEYQDVFREMRRLVLEVHPWAESFIDVWCVQHGTCYFPRYKECPIQIHTYNGLPEHHEAILRSIKNVFYSLRHEASPVAYKGEAQTKEVKNE